MAVKRKVVRPVINETPQPVQYVTSGPSSLVKILLPVLIVLLVASSFLIGVLWTKLSYVQKSTVTTNPGTVATGAARPTVPPLPLDKVKGFYGRNFIKFGDAERKVLFVEIADPSCPFCHVAAGKDPQISKQMGARFQYATDGGSYVPPVPEMKKLVDSGKASFLYIYYPGHGNGEMGAKALFCASEQEKFWQAHDRLMSKAGYDLMNTQVKNDKTKSGVIASFLSPVVSSSAIKSCLDSGKYDSQLQADAEAANSLFAYFSDSGTPGFIVNTTTFPGAFAWDNLKSVVDAALK